MIMPRQIPDIAVVGAGPAGLACAERLSENGLQVQVYDDGRQPGGRVARCRRRGLTFEHGAPGYSNLVDRLAARVNVATRCRVTGLSRADDGRWRLYVDGHPLRALHASVVLAVPPELAVGLLVRAPVLAAAVGQAQTRPVLTALLGLATSSGRGLDHISFNDPNLAEATCQPSSHVDGPEAWVLHGCEGFSRDNLHCDPNAVAQHLWQRFRDALDLGSICPLYLQGHRWRHGRTEHALGVDCLHDQELGLGVCGDWCLGDGVEHALASGHAMAAHVLGIPQRARHSPIAAKKGFA